MNDNKFFDMDLDEPIVQEGSVRDPLMFYDDDEVVQEADENVEVEEPAVEEPSTDNAGSSADAMPEIPEFHKEFIESGEAEKFKGLSVGDEVGMTKIGRFFSLDEIPAEYKKVNDNIKDIKSPDGFIVKVIPVATADCDENGEMNDYIVLYEFQKKYQYGTLQTGPVVDLCMYARNVEDLMASYEYWSKHQVIEKDATPTEEPAPEEPATEEEPTADDAGDLDLDAEPTEDNTEEVGDGNEEVTADDTEVDDKLSPDEVNEFYSKLKHELGQESYVQEAFDMKSEAAKMIQRPEVRQAIADSIDKQFKELCGSWVNPTEAELKENRERVWNQIKDRPEIALSLHAKKYFDELLDSQTKAMRDDSMAKLEEMKKKLMERREKNVNEAFVQEDGEVSDEQTVGEAIEAENETADTGSIATSGDFDFSLDLDAPSSDDALEGSTTPEGDDLKDFGTDTSDVQNDYDPKEIEILNKLIAAEAEAINDYFDASKDSHDSNARRLYSDIGREERFHMEQLMFQKSQFTGEKYEPRDPEVKKEYEELLQLGMDDHTAMQTAIDKRSMETSSDSVDEMDFEILEYAANNSLTMLHQAEIILEASMYAYYHRADNTAKQYGIILEAYFQEEVVNTARAPQELKGTPNPFALLLKGFKAALKALSTLTANIRESSERNRINRHARMEWIKKNGITGLFKSGKYFYFYNDTDAAFNMVIPVQYVDLLYRLSVDIGKKCGVTVTEQGYHGTIKNPIKYGSIEDGMAKIRSLNMTKTKVIVTDKNKDALINEFFGYSDKKINVKVWNEEANRAIYESNNVYNKLMCFAMITGKYSQVTDQILEVMQGLQGNMNSIYYKDRNAYNKYVGYMETIVKTYMSITKAATSDLTEMLSLDKEGVKDVTASRDAGNKLPEGAEDRRTSGALGNNRANKQYAKTKK